MTKEMGTRNSVPGIFLWVVGLIGLVIGPTHGPALPLQGTADYLTMEEIEQVREAQPIDLRVKVLMKIADRRLLCLEDPQSPQLKKDEADWGRLPGGSREDLVGQFGRAIEETIMNIEEAYDRDPKDTRLVKALTTFDEHTTRHIQQLEAMRAHITEPRLLNLLDQGLDDLTLAHEDALQSLNQLKQDEERRKGKQGDG